MILTPGHIRKEVVACLAAADLGGEETPISIFGPAAEEAELKEAVGGMVELPEDGRLDYIVERLKALVAQEKFIGLSDIHPAWLLEVLSNESPRIIGIILRYLPSKQARYVIENLPKRVKNQLPRLIDAFAVPTPILTIIRERFERQFISDRAVRDFDKFRFEHVGSLKSVDLEVLFRDLGIHELAMALKGVDRRSLNILYNRLTIDEARALQQRIRSLVDVPASVLRDAKYTVLEMSLAETDSNGLLMDVGLNAFAKALRDEDMEMFPLINQKMEPRLGHTLKRYIGQHRGSGTDELAKKRQTLIIQRVSALAKAGSIDEGIQRYFVAPVPAPEPPATEEFQPPPSEAPSWHDEDGVI